MRTPAHGASVRVNRGAETENEGFWVVWTRKIRKVAVMLTNTERPGR